MMLQDSFEDDKSKILMILCASPDPKEMHKTISTLEYRAKAKCIVRAAHMPAPKAKMNRDESLRSRIVALNQLISKLEMDGKLKEKERDEAYKSLIQKEEEVAELKSKFILMEGRGSFATEEDINMKIEERTHVLRLQLMVMVMEQMMLQQQMEILTITKRLEEMESERNTGVNADRGRVIDDHQAINDVKEIQEDRPHHECNRKNTLLLNPHLSAFGEESGVFVKRLSVVFEEDEGDDRENIEVDKIIVQEKTMDDSFLQYESSLSAPGYHSADKGNAKCGGDVPEKKRCIIC